MGNGMTIYRTVHRDGPHGEERDLPVAFITHSESFAKNDKTGWPHGDLRIFPVLNLRGNAYAHRNDRRYRPNKKKCTLGK
jgi:hypothetical protein